ncbi:MAG: protein kinase [Vicinamibacterales bacterium]
MIDLSRWADGDDLLDRALDLPREQRVAFVRRHAGHDEDKIAALLAVIAEANDDPGFLEPGGALSGPLGQLVTADLLSESARLEPGTSIAHFEVGSLLGRGGMGEVYLATDKKLGRHVALKVLPDRFARDADRRARFQREARVLAALSHPGIAAIHGVAESGEVEALVLELVEGPTLAERLAEGPLTVAQAIDIAQSLVEVLGYAHGAGVLHRDLKPANIKLLPEAAIKVLDFGLAKVLELDSPGEEQAPPNDLTGPSPRQLLGTVAYMSPEQVRGEPVDQRTDIWAFGCVLFEMLTGQRAFTGESTADVAARVIEREPAFSLLPPTTPASLRNLLRHTLAKDPRRRLGYITDAALDLEDARLDPDPGPQTASRFSPAPLLIAAAAALAVVAVAAMTLLRAPASPPPLSRLELSVPAGTHLVLAFQPAVAVSPDGRTVVYRASRDGVTRLHKRSLGELAAVAIDGTDNATSPFFSPDGQWIGFDSGGTLKRVPIAGGEPLTICPTPGTATATWTRDDHIVFATNTGRVLQRVPVAGGEPETLTTLDPVRGDTLHLLPQALPDGRTVLFTVVSGADRHVAALTLDTGDTRLIAPGTHGRFVDSNHLVVSRDGSLWALPFDPDRLTVGGSATALATGVEHTDGTVAHYDVSPSGALVYLPARPPAALTRLAWFDRAGEEVGSPLDERGYTRIGLAADGTRLAAAIEQDDNTDIWVGDLARGQLSRLTLEPTLETMPTPTPDGRFVAFRSERGGPGIFRRDAQGAGPIERLTETAGPIQSPYSWTPDGKTLLMAVFRSYSSQAIASVTPPSREVKVLLDGDFAQLDPQVSPDGRWLAYQSDETGEFEIYVRPYPAVESGRWQVSVDGGRSPRWNPDGGELFFFDGAGIAVSAVAAGAAFRAGAPRRLFEVQPLSGRLGPDYEVDPGAGRFLFILPPAARNAPAESLVVVQNWTTP